MEIKDPKPDDAPLTEEAQDLIDEPSKFEMTHTVESFLANPAGSGTTFLFSRKSIMQIMEANYNKLLIKHKKFDYKVYKIDRSIVYHIKVPSETVESFMYDICIEFLDVGSSDSNILPNDIRFFSNSGSFIFTYAYAFNNNGLLINYLKDRLDKKVFSEFPKMKNPENIIGYEKTITYALMYIKQFRLTLRENFSNLLINSNRLGFRKLFLTQEQKYLQYNHFKKLQSVHKKQQKQLQNTGYNTNTLIRNSKKENKAVIDSQMINKNNIAKAKKVKANTVTNARVNYKVNNKVSK